MRSVFRSRRTTTEIRSTPAIAERRSPAAPLMLMGGGLLLLALLGVLVMGSGSDPRAAEMNPTVAPRVVARALPAEVPACPALRTTIAGVHALMTGGELAGAVALAAEDLRREVPASCTTAHAELARLWYTAELESLLATPAKDELLGRHAASRWLEIENRADDLGVPALDRRQPITVARNAYDRGLWQLSDAAFRRGWNVGEAGLASIEFRHALLRNWGHELAVRDNPGGRSQALGLLATAHAISKVHGLGTNVACTDLRAMGVVDCAKTSPDPGEPTLR